MISLSKIKSFIIEAGTRVLKVQQYGVKTAENYAPFGDDSQAPENTIAVYAETQEIGKNVILGYLNKNQISEIGEKRIFSLSSSGDIATYIHLKNDGSIEIGGNGEKAVVYSFLNQALQNQVSLINAELTKIQTAIAVAGGAYAKTDISLDISASESSNVKL